ncbi:MAG: argininosuccinate synthase [Planctomycetes bacterium]|nr:argininosuccinate synthase [Planctomycetota bacterium]
MAKKVVLAYTGGLETSICIHWLRYQKNLRVATFSANLGQGEYLEPVGERALEIGAEAAHVGDLRKRFVTDYVWPAVRAGAVYESGYLLANALTRPLIATELVKIALEDGAEYIAHGCTGKGNDQHRFEASVSALAPHIEILAPLQEWSFKSKEEEIAYAEKHNIRPLKVKKGVYSVDVCLWGRGVAAGPLEDPTIAPPEDAFEWTTSPANAPDAPREIEIGFEEGTPVALDGQPTAAIDIIDELNKVGGSHGVGRIDLMEDRIMGIKAREVYEAPAATLIYQAHRALEDLTMSKEMLLYREGASRAYAKLVYDGMWFSALRDSLDAFFSVSQKFVTGKIRLRLFKGTSTIVARESEFSLYDRNLARRGVGQAFGGAAAKGYFNIWNISRKMEADQRKRHLYRRDDR